MSNRFKIWYETNKEKRKADMRIYYHLNKHRWREYKKKRKPKLKSKGQKEFREKRAKCVHYLVRVKKKSYRQAAERLSIGDPKNVWLILKTYELNQSNGDNLA